MVVGTDRSIDQRLPVVLESGRCRNPPLNRGRSGNGWFEMMPIRLLRSHGTARQAISLGIAIWFVFVSVSVHGLHEHAGARCDNAAAESSSIEHDDHESPAGAACLAGYSDLEHGPRKDTGLCLACLFLKNCKERAVVWQSLEPVLVSDRHTSYRTVFRHTIPDIISSSPRAPPLSYC